MHKGKTQSKEVMDDRQAKVDGPPRWPPSFFGARDIQKKHQL